MFLRNTFILICVVLTYIWHTALPLLQHSFVLYYFCFTLIMPWRAVWLIDYIFLSLSCFCFCLKGVVTQKKPFHLPLCTCVRLNGKIEWFPCVSNCCFAYSRNFWFFYPWCPSLYLLLPPCSCPSLVWMCILEKSKVLLICMQSALVPAVNSGLKWKWEGEKEQITLLKRMHCLLAGPQAE